MPPAQMQPMVPVPLTGPVEPSGASAGIPAAVESGSQAEPQDENSDGASGRPLSSGSDATTDVGDHVAESQSTLEAPSPRRLVSELLSCTKTLRFAASEHVRRPARGVINTNRAA
jgi:hypothetical protein